MTPLEMFEDVCQRYILGSEKQKQAILSCFSDDERVKFLEGMGLYRMFTDSAYYKAIQESMCSQIYSELEGN